MFYWFLNKLKNLKSFILVLNLLLAVTLGFFMVFVQNLVEAQCASPFLREFIQGLPDIGLNTGTSRVLFFYMILSISLGFFLYLCNRGLFNFYLMLLNTSLISLYVKLMFKWNVLLNKGGLIIFRIYSDLDKFELAQRVKPDLSYEDFVEYVLPSLDGVNQEARLIQLILEHLPKTP